MPHSQPNHVFTPNPFAQAEVYPNEQRFLQQSHAIGGALRSPTAAPSASHAWHMAATDIAGVFEPRGRRAAGVAGNEWTHAPILVELKRKAKARAPPPCQCNTTGTGTGKWQGSSLAHDGLLLGGPTQELCAQAAGWFVRTCAGWCVRMCAGGGPVEHVPAHRQRSSGRRRRALRLWAHESPGA